MATCEMCGSETNSTTQIKVAGSIMNVCLKCKSMGQTINTTNNNPSHIFSKNKKENSLGNEVSNNYANLITNGMQKKKINLHQLARAVNIKESSLNNYVKGKIKPDENNARRIANFLNIELFESTENSNSAYEDYNANDDSSPISLGDMILKQMEKKK